MRDRERYLLWFYERLGEEIPGLRQTSLGVVNLEWFTPDPILPFRSFRIRILPLSNQIIGKLNILRLLQVFERIRILPLSNQIIGKLNILRLLQVFEARLRFSKEIRLESTTNRTNLKKIANLYRFSCLKRETRINLVQLPYSGSDLGKKVKNPYPQHCF